MAERVDRERIRRRVAAAFEGERYSVVEMAYDLERLATHPIWEQSNRAAADTEMLCEALEEILDDLGANRHIQWSPNYPEVDHAIQVARTALDALAAASPRKDET